ncbi:MAG: hypothetical protein IJ791_04665, partial [Lachnospiraceae bacterium]|nr:hypothetical protein [Lachnospiraceae bacterium]
GTHENSGISLTKRDFRLQKGNLAYKTGISFTKWDSWNTNGTLGLLFTQNKTKTIECQQEIIEKR